MPNRIGPLHTLSNRRTDSPPAEPPRRARSTREATMGHRPSIELGVGSVGRRKPRARERGGRAARRIDAGDACGIAWIVSSSRRLGSVYGSDRAGVAPLGLSGPISRRVRARRQAPDGIGPENSSRTGTRTYVLHAATDRGTRETGGRP